MPLFLWACWWLSANLHTSAAPMAPSADGPSVISAHNDSLEGPDAAAVTRVTHGGLAFLGCLVLACASLASCIALEPSAKNFAFYLLPLRAWEILMGSLLAFDRRHSYLDFLRTSNAVTEASSACGLGMIIASFFIFSNSTPWPSYPTLLPTLGTVAFMRAHFASLQAVLTAVL
jgi:peptidoglycan/LPS O-acetylase OafA/YrhL